MRRGRWRLSSSCTRQACPLGRLSAFRFSDTARRCQSTPIAWLRDDAGSAGGCVGRKSGRIRTAARAMGAISALAVARSVALFVGAYSLASTVAGALSRTQSQDLWWIDLRFLPSMVGLVGGVACSVVLLAFAVAPKMAGWRRVLTLVACVALAAAAMQNVTAFYRAWGARLDRAGRPIPVLACDRGRVRAARLGSMDAAP